MKYKKAFVILSIFTIIVAAIAGCSNPTQQGENNNTSLEKHAGIIAEKKDNRVLVIANIEEEDISNKTEEELIVLAQEKDGAFYNIATEEYNKVKVGEHVIIYWNGAQLDSDPPQRGAEKIEIISNE